MKRKGEDPGVPLQVCISCGDTKAIDEFQVAGPTRSRLKTCRDCMKEKQRAAAKNRQRTSDRKEAARLEAIAGRKEEDEKAEAVGKELLPEADHEAAGLVQAMKRTGVSKLLPPGPLRGQPEKEKPLVRPAPVIGEIVEARFVFCPNCGDRHLVQIDPVRVWPKFRCSCGIVGAALVTREGAITIKVGAN